MNHCDLAPHNHDLAFCIYEIVYHDYNMKYDLLSIILTMT